MNDSKHLYILWTSVDPQTARLMVLMYATNSMLNSWWDEVTIIIWGAAAKLVAEDEDIQDTIRAAARAGVEISACSACARQLGVLDDIAKLDIDVRVWGEGLTEILQENRPLLTV